MIDIKKLPDDVLNGVFRRRYKEVDNNETMWNNVENG